jgi:hypothetical protein
MPLDTADREAHVATARRRLADVERRGAGYPVGHEPRLWLESVASAHAKLVTAERLLRNTLRS